VHINIEGCYMLSHHQYKTINYGTVNTSLQQHKLT